MNLLTTLLAEYSEYTTTDSEGIMAVAIFYGIYLTFVGGFALLVYIFNALGYYAIAKRRGINNPWLAWVPIGNQWLAGCISDQYQAIAKGKTKNKRKVMLILDILLVVCIIVMIVLLVMMIVQAIALEETYYPNEAAYEQASLALVGPFLGMLLVYFLMLGLAIALTVLQYMALYDLFTSCNPDNSVLFLVLSIFLGISPFLVFASRKKDLGLPPREPQPPVYGYQPPMYGQPPVYGQPPMPPQWQPPQPPVPPAPPAPPAEPEVPEE